MQIGNTYEFINGDLMKLKDRGRGFAKHCNFCNGAGGSKLRLSETVFLYTFETQVGDKFILCKKCLEEFKPKKVKEG